jgi:hypothetical protein
MVSLTGARSGRADGGERGGLTRSANKGIRLDDLLMFEIPPMESINFTCPALDFRVRQHF